MFYENEFGLLCTTLSKLRVPVTAATTDYNLTSLLDESLRLMLSTKSAANISINKILDNIASKTVYRFQDAFGFRYITFLLPNYQNRVILIGPYLREAPSYEQILSSCEKYGIPPGNQKIIYEYISSVPVIADNNAVLLLIDAFCERLWDGSFNVTNVQPNAKQVEQSNILINKEKEFDTTFLDIKNMERRYQMENEIMEAVMLGSEHKMAQIFSSFTDNFFEMRLSDPLRNSKNYCIIMNTLLRKAAERGGVHPVYLNKTSSLFARKIEQLSTLENVKPLMADMFHTYCRLVNKHASKDYSPIVQKAVIAIDSDPSVELNLHILAQKLNVSNVYLSSVFKKETGKTITEYIRDKRLAYAMYLLECTNLQIQTIALHCGMVDIHYFSKQFKRHTGKTPSQYRNQFLQKG